MARIQVGNGELSASAGKRLPDGVGIDIADFDRGAGHESSSGIAQGSDNTAGRILRPREVDQDGQGEECPTAAQSHHSLLQNTSFKANWIWRGVPAERTFPAVADWMLVTGVPKWGVFVKLKNSARN